jgi:hypothetical protein
MPIFYADEEISISGLSYADEEISISYFKTEEEIEISCFKTEEEIYIPGWICDEEIYVGGFDVDEEISILQESDPMAMRIHSYAFDRRYAADLEVYKYMSDTWVSLRDRIIASEPISVTKKYREIYTASLTLNNNDGLLTPENKTSEYNLNEGVYDPLLDEARKVRLKQGIYCYDQISRQKTVTANVEPTTGNLTQLTDLVYADAEDSADTDWVGWNLTANQDLILTLDLGSEIIARHGMISFLSCNSDVNPILLPSSVLFEYSIDGSAWCRCTPEYFKMRPGTHVIGEDEAEYIESLTGMQYIAWFTDLAKTVRYIRATITNINQTNDIKIDEFCIWGGTDQHIEYKNTITGYLGDSITANNGDGTIKVDFQDVRKREQDNRRIELTNIYNNKRPEDIIYDLLTNRNYWRDEILLNKETSFESKGTWVYGSMNYSMYIAQRSSTNPKSGTYSCRMSHADAAVRQDNIPIEPGNTYICEFWAYGKVGGMNWNLRIVPDVGSILDYGPVASTGQWQLISTQFIAPSGSSKCTILVYTTGVDANASQLDGIDDFVFYEYVPILSGYGEPLDPSEIGWTADENLSGFTVTKWQGQQGTILDYINELAELIGWVYDADGNGVRQFWEPEDSRHTPHPHLTFFGDRWGRRATPERTKRGKDIRNYLKITAYEGGSKTPVTREYRNQLSINKYGTRYGRINEPLVTSSAISDQLAKSLLRDFAYANDGVNAGTYGDFDLDKPCRVCSFHEPIRAHLDKNELWKTEEIQTEMTTDGQGSYNAQLDLVLYSSSYVPPVASVTCIGGAGEITTNWEESAVPGLEGYRVYCYRSLTGNEKRTKPDIIADNYCLTTGLTEGAGYWVYVTAVNTNGDESEPSAPIYCVASAGQAADESTTWGIADLAATIGTSGTDNAVIILTWTPSIQWTPDYMLFDLCGPELSNPPVTVSRQVSATPENNVTETVTLTYLQAANASGDTLYLMLSMTDIIINSIKYKFSASVTSNVVSVTWP